MSKNVRGGKRKGSPIDFREPASPSETVCQEMTEEDPHHDSHSQHPQHQRRPGMGIPPFLQALQPGQAAVVRLAHHLGDGGHLFQFAFLENYTFIHDVLPLLPAPGQQC